MSPLFSFTIDSWLEQPEVLSDDPMTKRLDDLNCFLPMSLEVDALFARSELITLYIELKRLNFKSASAVGLMSIILLSCLLSVATLIELCLVW